MNIHKASNFLPMSTKDDVAKKYLYIIKALNLQTTVASNLNLDDDYVSQYLDVCCNQNQQFPFEKEDYLQFLRICLEDFRKSYEDYLFQKLAHKSGKHSNKDLDFFDRLRKIDPDYDTETILIKYLFVQKKTGRFLCKEKSVELFENVSNVLWIKNYNNPILSMLLIAAVCFDSYLPTYILSANNPPYTGDTNSPERLDYVLHQMKAFCIKKRRTDVFLEFKRKNSIIPCVERGRHDLLEILLKYGCWKDFSTSDIYSWMHFCFDTPWEDSADIVDFLTHQRYDLKRFLLILQFYFACLFPLKKILRYYSTIGLLWRSTLHPNLSREELQAIHLMLGSEEKDFKVCNAREFYSLILCPGKLVPRSLKHYVRYAIRAILDQKALLPEGIDCLDVPEICLFT